MHAFGFKFLFRLAELVSFSAGFIFTYLGRNCDTWNFLLEFPFQQIKFSHYGVMMSEIVWSISELSPICGARLIEYG